MIWTTLGVSVAIVAVFCVTIAELFVGHPGFERLRPYICLVLALAGGAAWITGRYLSKKRAEKAAESEEAQKVFVLFDLRYWGPMLLALGVITLFIQTIKLQISATASAPPQTPPPKVEMIVMSEPEPVVIGKPPVVFPPLKVQGILLQGSAATAMVNGKSYEVGDLINGVVVKEITRNGVKVEKNGEVKMLSMD